MKLLDIPLTFNLASTYPHGCSDKLGRLQLCVAAMSRQSINISQEFINSLSKFTSKLLKHQKETYDKLKYLSVQIVI